MTRIISGAARGVRITVPKSGTRPTSDRAREAIFSSAEAWDAVKGANVLDLFSGSGALGLEALSRGAKNVTLVEKHPPAAAIIKKNAAAVLRSLRETDSTSLRVERASALTFLTDSPPDAMWDLVFIDPPYDFSDAALTEILENLATHLSERALIMVERSTKSEKPRLPEALSMVRDKRYGEATVYWAELT